MAQGGGARPVTSTSACPMAHGTALLTNAAVHARHVHRLLLDLFSPCTPHGPHHAAPLLSSLLPPCAPLASPLLLPRVWRGERSRTGRSVLRWPLAMHWLGGSDISPGHVSPKA